MLNYVQAEKQIEEMEKMGKWTKIPERGVIEKTAKALSQNGFDVEVVGDRQEARDKVLGLIPEGSEVMTMTSRTLDALGIVTILNESGKYNSVKAKLMKMDRNTQGMEMQKLGAAPEYATGSVHAMTEDGQVLIASNTGSQLSAYAYASPHVIWVVGAQKIVKNLNDGLRRIDEWSLAREAVRIHETLGVDGSNVSKILIVSREIRPQRVKIIIVREELGF